MRQALGVVVVILITSSVFASDFGLTATDVRAGESIGGFPNWGERVILAMMNRARVAPQVEMALCGPACGEGACYSAMPPLTWTPALNRAARFHADEMRRQTYFDHDSKCQIVSNIDELYPAGCDGSASCACADGSRTCGTGGCTNWSQRVSLFGARASGEIIALGADPAQSFYMWLYEQAGTPMCGINAHNIHRWLILSSTGSVGVGYLDENGAAVGDFGSGGASYPVPSGTHYPRQAAAVEAFANWYDSAPPRSASVVVDGRCVPMTLSRGTGTNGTWSANVTGVGSGCHRYYFSFIDSSGREVTYPATGSLGVGCEEWNESRVAASCSSAPSRARRRAAGR